VWMFFTVSTNESSGFTYEMVDNTLMSMLESQDYFNTSIGITYLTSELKMVDGSINCKSASVFFYDWTSMNSFVGFFRIQLSEPDPEMGSFKFWMFFDTKALKLNDTIDVSGVWLYVGRDLNTGNFADLVYTSFDDAFDKGETVSYTVNYREKVHYE